MTFALESAMDMLAEKMGIDPLEFRRMNSLQPGQSKSTGSVVGAMALSRSSASHPAPLRAGQKEAAAFKDGPIKRGVGLACPLLRYRRSRETRPGWRWNSIPDDGVTIYAAQPIRAKGTIPC